MPPKKQTPAGGAVGRRRVTVAGLTPGAGRGPKTMTLSERFSQLSKGGRGNAAAAAAGGVGKRRQAAANTSQANRHSKQMAARTGQSAANFVEAGRSKKRPAMPQSAMQIDAAGASGRGRGKGRAGGRGGKAPAEDAPPKDKEALDGDMDAYWSAIAAAGQPAAAAPTDADADASLLAGVPDSVVPDNDALMA
jgi:hypothetical protein